MYRVLGADQKEYGPVTADQIRQWIADRRLNAASLIMAEGGTWKPLSTFPEFATGLPPQPIGHPAAPPSNFSSSMTPQGTNTFCLVGMIMGIMSVIVLCCCYGFPFNVLGIVFSAIGLNQLKNGNPPEKGREMAIAGIILSILSLLAAIAFLMLGVAVGFSDVMRQMKGKF